MIVFRQVDIWDCMVNQSAIFMLVMGKTKMARIMIMLERMVNACWFHLQYQITSVGRDISWIEHGATAFKSSAILLPPVLIKHVEVIPPVEVKAVSEWVVIVDLDPVDEEIPRHVNRLQTISPSVEFRGPEVHFEVLSFVHKVYGFMVFVRQSTNLLSVDRV